MTIPQTKPLKFTIEFRWMKTLNVSLASEHKQRALARSIRDQNVVAEMGAFTFSAEGGGEEIREVPFVYVPNLIAKVADLVTLHEQ